MTIKGEFQNLQFAYHAKFGSPTAIEAKLLYRFGFIFYPTCDAPPRRAMWAALSRTWKRTLVDEFEVRTHPEAPIEVIKRDDCTLVLIGSAFQVGTGFPSSPLARIAAVPKHEIAEVLNRLSGRFALLVLKGGGGEVFHDAFGSRSIFYRSEGAFAAASHAELLAIAFGHRFRTDIRAFLRSRWFKSMSIRWLPGDATIFRGVRALAPNHFFDIRLRRCVRYWPLKNREQTTLDRFHASLDEYFAGFAQSLRSSSVLLSVTGGVDSRLLIAGLRRHNVAFEAMTFTGSNFQEWEIDPVNRIVEHTQCKHHWIDDRSESVSSAAMIGGRNGGGFIGPFRTVAALARLFGWSSSSAYIPGFGGEVLRGFYQSRSVAMSSGSAEEMARIYCNSAATQEPPDAKFIRLIHAEFEKFCDCADFGHVARLGYDLNDIFYWEHRVGMWASARINAMDAAIHSLFGFNSRSLACAAFGLADEIRLSKKLFIDAIQHFDPELSVIEYR